MRVPSFSHCGGLKDWSPRLRVTGIIKLDNLTAESVRHLHLFQRDHRELRFDFSFAPNAASVTLESFAGLAMLTRLAAQVETEERPQI